MSFDNPFPRSDQTQFERRHLLRDGRRQECLAHMTKAIDNMAPQTSIHVGPASLERVL
jgi:hypothetical protein